MRHETKKFQLHWKGQSFWFTIEVVPERQIEYLKYSNQNKRLYIISEKEPLSEPIWQEKNQMIKFRVCPGLEISI